MNATIVYCLSEAGRRVALEKGLPAQRVQAVSVEVPDSCKDHVYVDEMGKAWLPLIETVGKEHRETGIPTSFRVDQVAMPQGYSVTYEGRVERKFADLDSPIENPEEYLSQHKTRLDTLRAEAEQEAAKVQSEREESRRKQADLEKHRKAEHEKAKAEREAAEAKVERERLEWIEKHGSNRLKRMLAEDIECEAVYRDERLALERPGWVWSRDCDGVYAEPRNVPDDAFQVLDKARETDPGAELAYWKVDYDPESYDYEDSDGYEWTGYVAVSQFLGRECVYGLPVEYCE